MRVSSGFKFCFQSPFLSHLFVQLFLHTSAFCNSNSHPLSCLNTDFVMSVSLNSGTDNNAVLSLRSLRFTKNIHSKQASSWNGSTSIRGCSERCPRPLSLSRELFTDFWHCAIENMIQRRFQDSIAIHSCQLLS